MESAILWKVMLKGELKSSKVHLTLLIIFSMQLCLMGRNRSINLWRELPPG